MRAGRIRQRDEPDHFQTHHQPFLYFDDLCARKAPRPIATSRTPRTSSPPPRTGTLPAVSFYKPIGRINQHPHYADLKSGDAHLAEVVARLRASPNWKDMLIIVTADENGGAWDHVAPPQDRPISARRTRVPTLIISPFAQKGFVDHTVYDTTSILRTIETRFDLAPLTERDARGGRSAQRA